MIAARARMGAARLALLLRQGSRQNDAARQAPRVPGRFP
ncbi:hypothetical protein CBM2608_A240107 [Cupriavidus taiwanensis]|nr:hypothetical protein CBM2588_A170105 [Cupriavidus taiwanensis]SOZ23323.1 hypothetical protein CBM2608_A240107 [Cupriavidus taiwanensis]SPA45366.1 hypothetical protein CBM2629_A200104 [Cupriavidus taiwanensis]